MGNTESKDYNTKTDNARVLINKINLNNYPLYDLRSSDIQYIHTKNKDNDITSVMYDCYKLGFARALKYAGAEPPKVN